jgi:hypothetical protein
MGASFSNPLSSPEVEVEVDECNWWLGATTTLFLNKGLSFREMDEGFAKIGFLGSFAEATDELFDRGDVDDKDDKALLVLVGVEQSAFKNMMIC